MKDINRVGPSDDRQAKVDALINKLRQRGDIGDSSEMGSAENFFGSAQQASWLTAKPEESEAAPEQPSEAPADAENAAAAEEARDTGGGTVLATTGTAEATPARTSGIGGAWAGQEAAEVGGFKPKVSTWGVFERPADISKAYGGGRKIGVGGFTESKEERERKEQKTKEALAAYRRSIGADQELEKEHEAEIRAALKEGRQLMRYGATRAAREELEKVREWLCPSSELGGETLLELSMAIVADGDDESAKPILTTLQRHPSKDVKRAAQQILFQEDAQDFLRVEKGPANAEFAKMATSGLKRSLGVAADRRYATAVVVKPLPVKTLAEARLALRSAAVTRTDRGAPQRITQALQLIATQPAQSRLAADTASALSGTWLLGFTASGDKLAFAPPGDFDRSPWDQKLTVGPERQVGSFERLVPGPLGLVALSGPLETEVDGDNVTLRLGVESRTLGPLPLPGPSELREQLLLLDATLCVTKLPGREEYAVWYRPNMTKAADDDEEY